MRCLLLGACLAVAACGDGPRSTAETWLDALNRGDLSQALELSSDPIKALLNIGSSMGEDLAIGDYEIVSVRDISDTRAEVVVSALPAGSLSFNDARDTDRQPAKRWRDSMYGVLERTVLGRLSSDDSSSPDSANPDPRMAEQ